MTFLAQLYGQPLDCERAWRVCGKPNVCVLYTCAVHMKEPARIQPIAGAMHDDPTSPNDFIGLILFH